MPKLFFKKLKPFYRYQLTFSVDAPTLPGGLTRLLEGVGINKLNFNRVNLGLNVCKCVRLNYPSLREVDILEISAHIMGNYEERIKRYMSKKFAKGLLGPINKPYHNSQEALREQIARGFTFMGYVEGSNPEIAKKYYLKSTIFPGLIYPKAYDTMEEAVEAQLKIGIEGYTGINQPIPK